MEHAAAHTPGAHRAAAMQPRALPFAHWLVERLAGLANGR